MGFPWSTGALTDTDIRVCLLCFSRAVYLDLGKKIEVRIWLWHSMHLDQDCMAS